MLQRSLNVATAVCFILIAPQSLAMPPFSGERALQHLVDLCALGPRVPGTPAHDAAHDFLVERLRTAGAFVRSQPFVEQVPGLAEPVTLRNIIAEIEPARDQRVIISAHWDSRPWADADPDSTRHDEPVLGANDAASGCAVLLTLAEMLATESCAYGVDLVFFDGEDFGQEGDSWSFCRGSQAYVREMVQRPVFLINLDMIGGNHLRIRPDRYTAQSAPQLLAYVWDRARRLGLPSFEAGPLVQVFDDHVPFLEAGVQAVNLIDFDYVHWHTVEDTPDKINASSLAEVGELVTSLLYAP